MAHIESKIVAQGVEVVIHTELEEIDEVSVRAMDNSEQIYAPPTVGKHDLDRHLARIRGMFVLD